MKKEKRNKLIIKTIVENTPDNGLVWKHNQDEMIVTPKEVIKLLKKIYEESYIEGYTDCMIGDKE